MSTCQVKKGVENVKVESVEVETQTDLDGYGKRNFNLSQTFSNLLKCSNKSSLESLNNPSQKSFQNQKTKFINDSSKFS